MVFMHIHIMRYQQAEEVFQHIYYKTLEKKKIQNMNPLNPEARENGYHRKTLCHIMAINH